MVIRYCGGQSKWIKRLHGPEDLIFSFFLMTSVVAEGRQGRKDASTLNGESRCRKGTPVEVKCTC